METEKEFDPRTMTLATHDDLMRMWVRLWGEWPVIRYMQFRREDGEFLDLLQMASIK